MTSHILKLCWLIAATQYPIPVVGDYCITNYSSQTYYNCSYGCCSNTSYDPCCGRSNTAAIAGSISSIVTIGIIVMVVCLCCRRRRQNQQGSVVAYTTPQTQVMTVSGYPGPMMASQQNPYSAMPGSNLQQASSTWNQQTPPTWPHATVPGANTQPPPYQPNTEPTLYKSHSSGSYIHPVPGGPAAPCNAGGYINEGMGDGYDDYRIKEIRQNPENASPMNDEYEEPMRSGYEEPDTSRYMNEPVSSRSQENEYLELNFERESEQVAC